MRSLMMIPRETKTILGTRVQRILSRAVLLLLTLQHISAADHVTVEVLQNFTSTTFSATQRGPAISNSRPPDSFSGAHTPVKKLFVMASSLRTELPRLNRH